MPNWTDSQLDAINSTEGSVLVSAAAGSGKTAVLVERVKRLITREENPVDADRLLVVTFTRDAASEMKQRISREISKLIKDDPYNPALINQKKRFANANISTIDSFCGDIVREYFHALGISSDYRIGDKGELDVLSKKALDLTFEKFYNSDTNGFTDLLNAFSSAKKSDAPLRKTVLKICEFLSTQPFPGVWLDNMLNSYAERCFSKSLWGRIIISSISDNVNRLVSLMDSAERSLEDEPELSEKFLDAVREDKSWLKKLLTVIANDNWDEMTAFLKGFSPQKNIRAPKGFTNHPVKLSVAQKRDTVKREIEKLVNNYNYTEAQADEELAEMRLLFAVLFDIVREYLAVYSKLKNDKNILSFSDVEQLAVKLLAEYNGENGFVKTAAANEISKRFDAVIVDEYQDVNEVQELIFTSVSNGNNLFTVGDVKQSIYSFRQARPQIFIDRKDNCIRYDRENPEYPAVIILDKNFRSRSQVCDTVNFIFSKLMSKRATQMDYTTDEYLYVGADYDEGENCETEIALIEKSAFSDDISKAELEATYIAQQIHKLKADGYTVTGKDGVKRSVTYGDFAVILRNTSSGGAFSSNDEGKRKGAVEFVKHLTAKGVPAYCEDTENFFDSTEIKLLLNLLRVVDNPSLDIPLLSVICSPVYGFTPDELAEIRAKNRYVSLYSSLCQNREGNDKIDGFLTELGKLRQLSSVCTVDELIGRLLDTTALGAITSAVKGVQTAQKNINLLRVYARDFEKHGYKSLSDFIAFIDKMIETDSTLNAASNADSSTVNGVRVLSIHKSKGLEYPVCFIADTAHQFNRNEFSDDVLLDCRAGLGVKRKNGVLRYNTLPRTAVRLELERNQIAEVMRLFYVALTRAREKLYIIGTVDGAEKFKDSVYSKLSGNAVEPYSVSSCKSMFEWTMLSALLNPSVRKQVLPHAEAVTAENYPEWRYTEIKSFDDIINPEGVVAEITESVMQTDISEKINYAEILRKNLEFKYPNAEIMELPQKVTASQIAHSQNDEYFEKVLRKPSFIMDKAQSVDIGTAHHRFLQYCDFAAAKNDISAELDRLVKSGRLSDEQAESVDLKKLEEMLSGRLFERVMNSPKVYREERFTAKIHPSLLDEKYKDVDQDTGIIMQGAVDLAFVEDGKLVIADYKTDRVRDIEKLRTLYKKQLELYSEALSKSLETEVKELIIYSIHLGDDITL